MEVKINREIREYTENMYFGLSLRQFFFSAAGCLLSIGIYFLLRKSLGTEAVSWACILGIFPCAVLGFVKYNGMTAEQLLLAVVKSEVLMPKKLLFRPVCYFEELMEENLKGSLRRKGEKKNEDTDKSF